MTKILIAEDDHFLANAYRVKFEKEGFEVTIAANGTEAIEYIKNNKPDVVLLDLIMPEKDGFGVLEELKQSSITGFPILIASNLGQQEDIKKALELGGTEYFIKSDVSLGEIVEKVKKLIK